MKKLFYFALCGLPFLFVNCGGNDASENTSNTDSLTTDTSFADTLTLVPVRTSIDVTALLERVDTIFTLPFSLNEEDVESWSMEAGYESDLSNGEVQHLAFEITDNDYSNYAMFSISEFADLDSMIIKGEYDDYVENLDLGEVESAYANLIGRINLSENQFLLLWSTDYSTVQACPYGHGFYVWATLFTNEIAINTTLIAENSGGADAPYWNSRTISCSITSKKIELQIVDGEGGEMDEETDEEIEDYEEFTESISIGDSLRIIKK